MELQQLRNFVYAAEYKNISRASREMLISQPALSRSIHALEQDIGVNLFIRTSNGLLLTPQGEQLLRYAKEILNLEAQFQREVHAQLTEQKTIRLVQRCNEFFMVDILKKYQEKHPDIQFSILQNDDLALRDQEFDLAVAGSLPDEAGLQKKWLLSERFLCALSRSHPLATREYLTREDYNSLPQIHFGGHRQIQWVIQEQFHQHDLLFQPKFICDDVCTGCNLVRAGLGLLFVPEYAVDNLFLKDIVLIPLADVDIRRDVYLYRRANSHLLSYAEAFQKYLIRYFQQRKEQRM